MAQMRFDSNPKMLGSIDTRQSTYSAFPLLICIEAVFLMHEKRKTCDHLALEAQTSLSGHELEVTWRGKHQNLLQEANQGQPV